MNARTGSNAISWLEIAVEVAGVDSEVAADVLRQGCRGRVAIELSWRLDRELDAYVVDDDGPAVVKGYLPAGKDSERVRKAMRLALKMAPVQSLPRWRRARRLRESSWRDSWKRHFGIQRVGRALVVAPSWIRYRLKDGAQTGGRLPETLIRIDPGMAFGTGQHPTTAMCLRALEDLVRPGTRALDLGCGSGILAIAAAKLGAARVLALDVDPLAVKATRQNAAANGVAHLIEAREGTLEANGVVAPLVLREPPGTGPSGQDEREGMADDGEQFGLVAANISGLALERLAGAIARSLTPGGAFVSSGFLEETVEALSRAFEQAGLRVERIEAEGVWRAIVARPSTGSG